MPASLSVSTDPEAVLVTLAVALMVWLGVWQLHRLAWKEGLIARYTAASVNGAEANWPVRTEAVEGALYHRSVVHCAQVLEMTAVAGTSASGADASKPPILERNSLGCRFGGRPHGRQREGDVCWRRV